MTKTTLSPVKAGLCSYGMSGRVFHAPFLDCLPEFELAAVTERHAKKAADRYPDIHSYDTIDALLADDQLELIIVNTPNTTHYPLVKTALTAGKHVVVEKPFAATYTEAQELAQLAEKTDRLLVVFQNRRWDSDFLAVREILDQRRLGQLIEAEFHYDRYRVDPSPKMHKEQAAPGVGLIYDLGPHLIDQAISLFGKPDAVFAQVQSHRPGSQVDDYLALHLLYPTVNCTVKSGLLVREPLPAYVLHGTLGSFHKSRSDVQETELDKGSNPCAPGWGTEPETEAGLLHTTENGIDLRTRVPSPKGRYQEFYLGVYRSLRQGTPSPVPLADSLLNMQIIEAALESQQKRSVIALH